jgi:Signal transduction histidine kinase
MFKSVFTKYITAFMVIIIISFTILAAIITSIIVKNTEDSKYQIINNTTYTASMYLEMGYNNSEIPSFEDYIIQRKSQIQNYLTLLTYNTGDMVIFITDREGNIMLTDGHTPPDYLLTNVPTRIIEDVINGVTLNRNDDLGGVFSEDYQTWAAPVYGLGENLGFVFASSASNTFNILVETMIKTIIMASLWVLLAALVAVYFISERIIAPLKDMSKAAKSFANGQFDVRVPVTGRDEVSELAVAFNNMAGSLANFEDMRRSFLANVSHDLKSPMMTISGFITNILEGVIPPEKNDYYLGIVKQEILRLSRLVTSLLDISRIQAGDRKFNYETFDICEMAREILISFEEKIEAKKLDVEFECDADNMYVSADKDAIHRVLYNICDNGIKFSDDGGRYSININQKDKKIQVSVYNAGQGITKDDLPYVFERFYKADKSRGLDKTGTGLGMYISKIMMDAHHEKIWVESEYGKYCQFSFTLQKSNENILKNR